MLVRKVQFGWELGRVDCLAGNMTIKAMAGTSQTNATWHDFKPVAASEPCRALKENPARETKRATD